MCGGISLAVRWLRLCAYIAGDTGSILDRGTKIPHSAWCGQKKKKKEEGKRKRNVWKRIEEKKKMAE